MITANSFTKILARIKRPKEPAMATTATNHRTGDPAVLAMFDAWVNTPMAFDGDGEPLKADYVQRDGQPVVITAKAQSIIAVEIDWITNQPGGATVAITGYPNTELVVVKVSPATGANNDYSILDGTFEWRMIIEHTVPWCDWRDDNGRLWTITVTCPLGWHRDGDNSRVRTVIE